MNFAGEISEPVIGTSTVRRLIRGERACVTVASPARHFAVIFL